MKVKSQKGTVRISGLCATPDQSDGGVESIAEFKELPMHSQNSCGFSLGKEKGASPRAAEVVRSLDTK